MAVERPQGDVIATYMVKFDADVVAHPAGSETFVEARRAMQERYGDRLGDGLFSLTTFMIKTEADKDALYDVLAEEIATRLEGSHEDRTIGIRAMLEMQRRTIEGLSKRY